MRLENLFSDLKRELIADPTLDLRVPLNAVLAGQGTNGDFRDGECVIHGILISLMEELGDEKFIRVMNIYPASVN